MEPGRKAKGWERDEEWGAVEEKALRVRPDQARARASAKERVRVKAAERVKARKAVLAKEPIDRAAFAARKRRMIMPGGDGTGPLGMGPMTGRGAGFCGGFGSRFRCGRGFGGRRGIGFGQAGGFYWSHPAYGVYDSKPFGEQESDEDEISILKNQIKDLQSELDLIKKRL